MSDLKFSCEKCGQHICADDAWAGHQIQCPNCQQNLTVPQTIAPPPLLKPVAPSSPAAPAPVPRVAAPQTPATPKGPTPVKLWLLALAPLPLAVIGFLTMGIGIIIAKSIYGSLAGLIFLIPSVLCAHAAVNEKQSNRAISGTQAAGVAAVIAYCGMVIAYLLILMILFRSGQVAYYRMTGQITTQPKSSPFMSGRSYDTSPLNSAPAASATRKNSTAPAKPAEPPVATDLKTVTIPDAVPSGTLFNAPFTCTGIQYDDIMSTLEIYQGSSPNQRASIKMFLFLNKEPLAGRAITIAPNQDSGGIKPHIYLTGINGKNEVLPSGHVLRLEFGQPENGVLTGRIYLEGQKSYGTKISGTFKFPAK